MSSLSLMMTEELPLKNLLLSFSASALAYSPVFILLPPNYLFQNALLSTFYPSINVPVHLFHDFPSTRTLNAPGHYFLAQEIRDVRTSCLDFDSPNESDLSTFCLRIVEKFIVENFRETRCTQNSLYSLKCE